ncbi:LysE/ArgO family amino acid transporter [Paracoccus sp. Z330]|uniref:LysE/ArgO family amino acid transporter n=1 Tax=Paracoccus onchidii TaxID=3017813 RepID=A0ABT4ZJ95_9RHOB|nr:LysE/ArgO family amino acid transporter [Paracoccus onchidii]MDB6179441.1 LysE/ArgO family amino acid transporter [Paracoccus onchidii]
MTSYFAGLGTGLSLILAIGAQNAFVLKQGLLRNHVLAVCLFCAVSDAILIVLGVGGMTAIADMAPWLIEIMRWGGVAFLVLYGAKSFWAAIRGGEALTPKGTARSMIATLASVAAITWLNPHVWLDTVVLLGSISAQWPSPRNFGAGAVTGSFLFFLTLGYGARFLAPLFARPRAWQWLELGVGAVMWGIAARLVLE